MPDADLLAAAALNPIALVNRATPGLACVVADYDAGTRQIVDHLASLGHQGFVFLGGPRSPGRVPDDGPACRRPRTSAA